MSSITSLFNSSGIRINEMAASPWVAYVDYSGTLVALYDFITANSEENV